MNVYHIKSIRDIAKELVSVQPIEYNFFLECIKHEKRMIHFRDIIVKALHEGNITHIEYKKLINRRSRRWITKS
jgi:hypothetical protein